MNIEELERENQRLREELENIQELLRETIIKLGGNDPSDSEDATAESVISEIESRHDQWQQCAKELASIVVKHRTFRTPQMQEQEAKALSTFNKLNTP